MKQRHRCWARRQAPPQAPSTKASRSLLLWTLAALSRCRLRTSLPMHLSLRPVLAAVEPFLCVSLASLDCTGGSSGGGGYPCLSFLCPLPTQACRFFQYSAPRVSGNNLLIDWLTGWIGEQGEWTHGADRSPMHLPEDPLTSPTRTPMGIKRDVGLCPRHRRRDRRALRHQDVSLPSHQTWAGYRPVKGKGWPCCLPSGHRIRFQFRTHTRVCCGDPGLQQANPRCKAPVWSHPTHQAPSYTLAEQIFQLSQRHSDPAGFTFAKLLECPLQIRKWLLNVPRSRADNKCRPGAKDYIWFASL